MALRRNSKSSKSKRILIVGLAALLFGIAAVWIGITQSKFLNIQLSKNTPTPQSDPFSTLYHRDIVPLNAGALSLFTTSNSDQCSTYPGMKIYSSKNSPTSMSVNNVTGLRDDQKQDMYKVYDVLIGATKLKQNDFPPFNEAFRYGCSGFYTILVKELPEITYPGTENAKAYMMLYGQDYFESLMVAVIANHESSFVYLTDYSLGSAFEGEGANPILVNYRKACEKLSEPNTDDKRFNAEANCYHDKVFADRELETRAINAVNNLLETYKLDPTYN